MDSNASQASWRLPDGMDELLPPQAAALEWLRRTIYDMHIGWGFQPVEPPFVEYIDSLLSGTGRDFDRQTFKVTDPLSGRTMGVRADMTPQVARIDAHHLSDSGVSKLFYLGTVVRAHADGIEKNRAQLQLGAEIFGHSGPQSDVEVIQLMLATLNSAGIQETHLDVGHVGIFRGVSEQLNLSSDDQSTLFTLLQKKSVPDIKQHCHKAGFDENTKQLLCRLCSMHGDHGAFGQVSAELAASSWGSHPAIINALQELQVIVDLLLPLSGNTTLHFDLAEVRGYEYHTGPVFAAYTPGFGSEIARGGRYDGIGETFGQARPATGYSTDLKLLMRCIDEEQVATRSDSLFNKQSAILCPHENTPELQAKVQELRQQGEIVIRKLSGLNESVCDRVMQKKDNQWVVESL